MQSIITSTVTEQGMDWWRNYTAMSRRAPHVVSKDYQFHGTFKPVDDNDLITYGDYFYFTVRVNGNTGAGSLHVWGELHNVR
ncbi:hypothetical protein [Rhizomonospora bruguierae]|uniref:hypothetical protein n=1 Tax=Rhizomonospora bruguierae TaxID=1581705 RepID=UPI001BCEACB8|nr:hypothetical protein [Micromonospora sp. NBRC 107566]